MNDFKRGFKDGFPIGLGYFSVSFTFGIRCIVQGLTWYQATIISMLVLTSAGQFAGINVMMYPYHYLEMLISQLTINVRYTFMAISLSQKVSAKLRGIFRWIFGFFITDEIFAVGVAQEEITIPYFTGLVILPWLGWSSGTALGAILGSLLPDFILSALGVAIYGMFVAIVVPDMKASREVSIVVVVAMILSCVFYYLPGLKTIQSGLTISIVAIVAALFGAIFFPKNFKEEK